MSVPRSLLDPRSIAVVGASDDPAKWGHWLARGALRASHRRPVWLVNRRGTELLGQRSHATVGELPAAPDLMVLSVPAGQLVDLVAAGADRGTRAFLAVTAGLDAVESARLHSVLDAAGACMVGPNSLGVYDADAELSLAWGDFEPGALAIVSQSGQLGLEIANHAARAGVGVSRFCSVGNQLSLTAADVLESLVDHDRTRVVALYLESFADGPRLVAAMRALRRAGKPVLVLTTGGSEGSRRLARSHTGSLTSALDVVDAACRAAGAARVATPRQLVDTATVLAGAAWPGGPRIGVVSDSGGQGGIAADVAVADGLLVPALSPGLRARLAAMLPAGASSDNPVDLAGAGEADLRTYDAVVDALASSGEVDLVLVSGYLGCYGEDTPSLRGPELDVVARIGARARDTVPVVVHTMDAGSAASAAMRAHGVPAFGDVDAALSAVAHAVRLAGRAPREDDEPPARRSAADGGTGYWAARTLLGEIGVACPPARRLGEDTGPGCVDAAEVDLEAPFVLKADWLEHKSEHGGVVVGLPDLPALAAAHDEMRSRLGPGTYVVEEQDRRPGVVEMIVGARRDPDFGPVVLVGLGGVEAELWRDTRLELAPVDHDTALGMLDALTSSALLDGWRGRPAVDRSALADVVVAVSRRLAADDSLAELEVNPVRVSPDGALAVDALVVRRVPANAAVIPPPPLHPRPLPATTTLEEIR